MDTVLPFLRRVKADPDAVYFLDLLIMAVGKYRAVLG